jgi:hypothetical protein
MSRQVATTSPTEPTTKNGSLNPPVLNRNAPNAGPATDLKVRLHWLAKASPTGASFACQEPPMGKRD